MREGGEGKRGRCGSGEDASPLPGSVEEGQASREPWRRRFRPAVSVGAPSDKMADTEMAGTVNAFRSDKSFDPGIGSRIPATALLSSRSEDADGESKVGGSNGDQ